MTSIDTAPALPAHIQKQLDRIARAVAEFAEAHKDVPPLTEFRTASGAKMYGTPDSMLNWYEQPLLDYYRGDITPKNHDRVYDAVFTEFAHDQFLRPLSDVNRQLAEHRGKQLAPGNSWGLEPEIEAFLQEQVPHIRYEALEVMTDPLQGGSPYRLKTHWAPLLQPILHEKESREWPRLKTEIRDDLTQLARTVFRRLGTSHRLRRRAIRQTAQEQRSPHVAESKHAIMAQFYEDLALRRTLEKAGLTLYQEGEKSPPDYDAGLMLMSA